MAARVDQDVILAAVYQAPAKARVDQDIILTAVQLDRSTARVNQDILLTVFIPASFLPVLPVLASGQSTIPPVGGVRGPGWSIKKNPTYFNILQQASSGRTTVVTLARNPQWHWEFTFEVILDDPNKANPFFTIPLPATDLEQLTSFYSSVQGSGTFAYQPPDSARGGSFKATSVYVPVDGLASITTDGSVPVTYLRLGDILVGSGFTTATYLNGATATVVGINPLINAYTVSLITSGTHPFTSDSGKMQGGQPVTVDGNNFCELVNTIGSYPLTITGSPATSMTVEAIQLIDKDTFGFYANGAFFPNYRITKDYSLSGRALYVTKGQGVAPYQGITVQFNSVPPAPVTATYNYYYLCKFSEDTQDYQNFITLLWSCSSLKIQQTKH